MEHGHTRRFLIAYGCLALAAVASLLALAAGLAPGRARSASRCGSPAASRAEAIRTFLATAVSRRDVARSYRLVSDELHQGMGCRAWARGNIPVTPFPRIDWRRVDVRLLPGLRSLPTMGAGPGVRDASFYAVTLTSADASVGSCRFTIALNRDEEGWKVSYFAPADAYGAHA